MGMRALVVSLAPTESAAAAVGELRKRHPEAEVTLLVGAATAAAARVEIEAGEVLHWRAVSGRGLLSQVRARRFDLMLVVHGRDQYASGAYWKAVGLASCSRAREKVFWQSGERAGRHLARAVMVGALRAAVQVVAEVYVGTMGLLILAPMLIGIAVTDLSEALVGKSPAGAPGSQAKDRD